MPELNWVGKNKVVNHHLDVPYRVLERRYSFDADGQREADNGSKNMIIHGDNLEALKSLLPRYEGQIDVIYIDPPYNTGNEGWVYNDAVNDPQIKKWLGEVVGKEGEDLSRHDKWLCMMYPRLRLLQRLLSPTGAIFISIDDHEMANLHLICDEVFGSQNRLATFIWETSGNTDNQAVITNVHEYIFCYSKNINLLTVNKVVDPSVPQDSKIRRSFVDNSAIKNGRKNPASLIELPIGFPCEVDRLYLELEITADRIIADTLANGGWISREISKKYKAHYPILLGDLIVEQGRLSKSVEVYSGWANADKLREFISNGCAPLEEKDGTFYFYLSKTGVVQYRKEGRESHFVQTVLKNMGTTEVNKYRLEAMNLSFDFPKPTELIAYLLSMVSSENSIVLDSFAGSGTTAHAVLDMNKRDGLNRTFILVELGDYAETLTATRVKEAISGYGIGGGDKKVSGLGGDFSYFELGPQLLVDGNLNPDVPVAQVRDYIWFTETRRAIPDDTSSNPYYLGSANGAVYYFIYEPDSVTVLDHDFLATMDKDHPGESYIVYADLCELSTDELTRLSIVFKKIPRDITRL